MAREHFDNTRDAALFDCLSIAGTRLVSRDLRHLPGGYSEAPLEVHLKPETAAKLSFEVPYGGVLYGFVHPREAIRQRLGLPSPITDVTISDWDGRFVLIFETQNEADALALNVSGADVLRLLESCRRPPKEPT